MLCSYIVYEAITSTYLWIRQWPERLLVEHCLVYQVASECVERRESRHAENFRLQVIPWGRACNRWLAAIWLNLHTIMNSLPDTGHWSLNYTCLQFLCIVQVIPVYSCRSKTVPWSYRIRHKMWYRWSRLDQRAACSVWLMSGYSSYRYLRIHLL